MSLEALIELSRYYGSKIEYVLAGGGNTSWKDGDTLYVKASGTSLSNAALDSFVKLDRNVLGQMIKKEYPEPGDDPFGSRREDAVLKDMMAARKTEENKRPSVEALLHEILPFAFVVHLHPALVNGLCCSKQGEEAARGIFGEEVIWIPSCNPGYMLSRCVKKEIDVYYTKYGRHAQIIFLQNHGIFVGAESAASIGELYGEVMSKISAMIKRKPDFSGEKRTVQPGPEGASTVLLQNAEISALVKDRSSFAPVSGAFTPDHIVYSGSDPLFIEEGMNIQNAMKHHAEKTGGHSKIIAIQGFGVFGAAETEAAAEVALDLFKDAVKIAAYSESFGGPLFMAQDKIDFINNWEVERYRSSVLIKNPGEKGSCDENLSE